MGQKRTLSEDVVSPRFFRKVRAVSHSPGIRKAIETSPMIAKPKYKHRKDENDRSNREHRRREKALDEALQNTFPASDPVSVEQPMLPAADSDVDRGSGILRPDRHVR